MDLSPRVRAVCDLDVSEAREFAGRHEYDGKPQDLSRAGVRAGLARVAEALLGGIRGLAAGLTAGTSGGPGEGTLAAARAAHARLVAHVERAAAQGDPDPALGGPALAALMGAAEALPVDLGRLAEQADAERDRLHALLADSCARLGSAQGSRAEGSQPPLDVARE